ncbi:MAG: TonB-dependent receptor [Gammaproteobacteria bacterium]|nr:TonB-dependent receptor [Gammaproteobacteria bacterium]
MQYRYLLWCLMGLLPLAEFAAAQEVALEEIVVTSQKREESLQSVPIPVSALGVETLEDRQIVEAQDLERYVPSLKMTNNITQPTNLSASLRGSLVQDASLAVAESPFGIYVDDVYIGRLNGNNVRLADVERIEVLRGPQGTLYGRNTLAGAIRFISRDPGEQSWLKASAGFGNYDQYEASASAGGPLGDEFAGSFAIQFNGHSGYGTNLATNSNVGEDKNWAGRIKLRYMGGENFDATVNVSYADSSNDAVRMVAATTPDVPRNRQHTSEDLVPTYGGLYDVSIPDQDYSGGGRTDITNQPRGDTEQLVTSLTMSYDFDRMTLKSITGYADTSDFWANDFSGSGAILASIGTDSDQFSQELQLQGSAVGDRLNYTAGAFYFQEDSTQDIGWFFASVGGPVSRSHIDVSTESYAFFGQADYAITDKLTFTGGIRWISEDKEWDFDFQLLFIPRPPELIEEALEYDAWTPKLGLDYEFDTSGPVDSLMLYTSAAKGFKSGGFNGINIFNTSVAKSSYGPETNWTYEIGVKTEMFNNRFRLNANYFINRGTDITLNANVIVDGNPTFPVQNAGNVTIKGLELESTAILFEGFTAFVTGTFLDGRFREIDPTTAPANSMTAFGVEAEPPQTADFAIAVGFDYIRDIDLAGRAAAIKAGVDYYHTDEYVLVATQEFLVNPYNRINAYVGLAFDDRWEARLAMQNLEDDRSFITGSRGLGGSIALPPRTYKLTLSYSM